MRGPACAALAAATLAIGATLPRAAPSVACIPPRPVLAPFWPSAGLRPPEARLALMGLRGGGGQKKHQKKKRDEEKAARREQYDIQERWKASDQALASAPSPAPSANLRARARSPAAGMRADAASADSGARGASRADPECGGAGGQQGADGSSRLASASVTRGGNDDAMECGEGNEDPGESDVVFLDSDEVCLGPDGQHILGASEESCDGAEGRNAITGDAAGLALSEQSASCGGEAEWALRNEKDDSTFCLPHPEAVFAVALSPFTEGMVATGGGDDTVRLWSVADGRGGGGVRAGRWGAGLRELANATFADSVAALAFSHDGTYLAAAGMDGTVRVWLPDSGQLVALLEGAGGGFIWLEWHPRGVCACVCVCVCVCVCAGALSIFDLTPKP